MEVAGRLASTEQEVQAFDPDRDEITIIYKREPTVVYTECVTQLISEGKVKKTKLSIC